MKLSTLAKKEQFVGLFVGKNGSGKSGAIASFAELGPLKLYDLDFRARGILGMADTLGNDLIEQIEVIQPDFEKGWADLDKQLGLDLIAQKNGSFRFKTVAFESAATMQKFLVSDSQALRSRTGRVGKKRGEITFWTPDDYNYSSMGFFQFYFQYARLLKCNVIVSAWMVDKWAKPTKEKSTEEDTYAANEVIGQKIVLTEKLAEEVPGYFDEVYCFEKEETSMGNGTKYICTFESTLAKTCHSSLRNKKRLDFTNKSFYKEWNKLTAGEMNRFSDIKPETFAAAESSITRK